MTDELMRWKNGALAIYEGLATLEAERDTLKAEITRLEESVRLAHAVRQGEEVKSLRIENENLSRRLQLVMSCPSCIAQHKLDMAAVLSSPSWLRRGSDE